MLDAKASKVKRLRRESDEARICFVGFYVACDRFCWCAATVTHRRNSARLQRKLNARFEPEETSPLVSRAEVAQW